MLESPKKFTAVKHPWAEVFDDLFKHRVVRRRGRSCTKDMREEKEKKISPLLTADYTHKAENLRQREGILLQLNLAKAYGCGVADSDNRN